MLPRAHPPRNRWLGLPLAAALLRCSSGATTTAWPGALCEQRLPGAPLAAEVPPDPQPLRSRVLVEARIEIAAALAELERSLPRRLAERRDVELGDPGRLSFTIDRGPFSLALSGDELSIDVDLRGQAEVCKPVPLLGCVGYASCSPGGHARASLQLLLGEDYRLLPSRVQIPVTRPCTLSALGIDMTAEVQAQANRQADEIHGRIDGTLPELGETVTALWRSLATTVPLGASSCARISPQEVLQTGPRLGEKYLSVGLGVEGEIAVLAPCLPSPAPSPLPSLRTARDAAPGVDLRIPLRTSWPEVGLALTRALALAEPQAGDEVFHVTEATAAPGPEGKVRLGFTLAGRSCGQVSFDTTPEARPDGLFFTRLTPAPGESERLRAAGSRLDLVALGGAVESRLRLPLPAEVSGMHRRIEGLTARLLGGEGDGGPLRYRLAVKLLPARVEGAQVTREGLAALVAVAGEAVVELSPTR